ncbi:unnamed protein product, partial [Porites evermanni]
MTFTSKCACDDGCVTPTTSPVDPTNPSDPNVKPKHKRLSKGRIILIIFFVLAFAYLIGGILIKKFKMGAEGLTEMVPNYEFWADILSLIKKVISATPLTIPTLIPLLVKTSLADSSYAGGK